MHTIFRVLHLLRLIIIYRLDSIFLPYYYCFSFWFCWLAPISQYRLGYQDRSTRLVDGIVKMGPTFVKFGQIISTRIDILPNDIAIALATLQDDVPPCSKSDIEDTLSSLPFEVDKVFESFSWEVLGSASIAQVHSAVLTNGHHVAVKILRPHISDKIQSDILVLRFFAHIIHLFHPNRSYLRIFDVVEEFQHTCVFECDLRNEAGNYHYMRHLYPKSEKLYVPKVYWEYSNQHVLVIERVRGIPINDITALTAAGVNLEKLAKTTVELFFSQVFEHNFFHADLHPGNLFVHVSDPENPQYAAVDYGIVGSLSPNDQTYLAENIYAFTQRDYQKVVDLHIESGWVDTKTRRMEMISSIRAVGESIYDRPLEQINCAELLFKLIQVARRYGMIVQPQLLLLQKTLIHVEALGRKLHPHLNMWTIVSPFISSWISQRKGVRANFEKLLIKLPKWLADDNNHFSQHPDTPVINRSPYHYFFLGVGTTLLFFYSMLLLMRS